MCKFQKTSHEGLLSRSTCAARTCTYWTINLATAAAAAAAEPRSSGGSPPTSKRPTHGSFAARLSVPSGSTLRLCGRAARAERRVGGEGPTRPVLQRRRGHRRPPDAGPCWGQWRGVAGTRVCPRGTAAVQSRQDYGAQPPQGRGPAYLNLAVIWPRQNADPGGGGGAPRRRAQAESGGGQGGGRGVLNTTPWSSRYSDSAGRVA